MNDLINRKVAINTLKIIKQRLWEIDIPSPVTPEYVEHHEQIKEMIEIVDSFIKDFMELPEVEVSINEN